MTLSNECGGVLPCGEERETPHRILLEPVIRPGTAPLSRLGSPELRLLEVLGEELDPAGGYALTPLQHGMLYQALLEPGSGVNVEQVVCRLSEPVDGERLESAWAAVVRRHDVLRTRFRWLDVPEPVQEVVPAVRVELALFDWQGLAAAERERELEHCLAKDRERGFDLAEWPAMRLALFRMAPEQHVLVWSFHHILLDARSITLVLREAFALYDGETSEPGRPAPFRDHVAWLGRRDAARDEGFWAERLRGLDATEPVRGVRAAPRDPRAEPAFGERGITLGARADAALRVLKRERGVNVNTVVQGAWACVLGACTGRDEAVFGMVRGGRAAAAEGADGMVGMLVNTTPVRVPLPGRALVADLLAAIAEANAAVLPHEHAALFDIARWSGLPPETALFDTIVNYLPHAFDAPLRGKEGRGFRLREQPGHPLALLVTGSAPLGARLVYDADRFDAAAADRMLDQFARVLTQMVTDPGCRLDSLDLLGDAERARIVYAWNETDAGYPAGRCVHQLFEAQAAATPGAVAVTCGERSLTYARLNERANRIARLLARQGVGPEARVGLLLERGLEVVEAILGVLKAGAAYVPLDPAYPRERLRFILDDAGAAALLTREPLRDLLPVPDGVAVVCLDTAAEALAAQPADDPNLAVEPRGLAYLIYTSGSTGVPKGVALEHRSAVALLSWAAGVFDADALSGVLASTSICFDLSVLEILLPLSRGGRVIVAENALALAGIPARDQVRLLNTVPSAAAALLANGGIPAGVTTVNLAGEPLRAELVDALYARGVGRVYDLYGPSEDTTYSTWTLRRAGGPETIGRPISNTRAYVLDAALRPVPVGVPGELHLAGLGLARGYLGRPGMTADRFVPDPFAPGPGGRMYRTGDRVRWLPDGTLSFLGRLDGQVKVRGFRIELGEVEAALRRVPGVRECAVVVRGDAPGGPRLTAYAAGAGDAGSLRAALRGTLPEHMVPGTIVMLEALPLTPNGKVDRRALPAPEAASGEDAYAAPRTPVEEVLAGICASVLNVERVGVHDSFFQLGGHSLTAMRLLSRVRAACGVELPVRTLFEAPTVAGLAGRVEALRRLDLPRPPAVEPVDRDGALPLSFAQERLWFLDRLQPGSPLYNVPCALRLRGVLDAGALERALGGIVRRHEALRTTFREAEGAPRQVVVPFGGFALPVRDLSGAGDVEAEAARRAAEDAGRPFDLGAGPLFRACLLRLGADDHVLLLNAHHIVIDGWSLDVLHRELAALYDAHRRGREPALDPLPVQYADYAAWERRSLHGETAEAQLAWWRERMEGAPALLELPADHPRPAVQSYRGAREPFALAPALARAVHALARHEGATPYMVLLAAFNAVLARYTGRDDLVVGSAAAGRARAELEPLIGCFVRTLVVRTDLGGDPPFRDVLRRVRGATLGAYEHQDLPFERLVQALRPERSLSHAPLFQVMFVQEGEGAGASLAGVRAERLETASGTSKFDLTVAVTPRAGGVSGAVEYSTDLFERETIARMLRHLARVLEQVTADPDLRLSALELLDAAERAQVLHGWNHTEATYPAGACIHQLFEAQSARTPDAPAVVFEGETLAYAALNRRANQLARRLARRGVGPEVRVGLCLERSLEMVVSVLAVLKAGGAYVPLDPRDPPDRLRAMREDSGVSLVVAQERLRGVAAGPGVEVLAVDTAWEGIAAERGDDLDSGATASTLAYVIYTSGSTGNPKGVMNQHGGVVNRLCWMQAEYGLGAGDVVLQKTPFSFDVSVWELFWPLQQGATLVVARPDGHRDPGYLREVIERHGVTTLHFVPSMLQPFVETADAARCASLKRVICSGEALPPALVARFHARFPAPVALHNLYGPTEAAIDVSHWPCARGAAADVVPIGRPVWNTRLHVLDAFARPAPVGVPGELYIGGVQVARGYLGRPALTAGRFVPDPFSSAPGARLYRTGDRARRRADGALEYLGRLDHQVKLRGFRIELGEIESVLREHAGVADCVVAARGEHGETRLVAYVVGDADADTLRAALCRRLPEHMVPGAFVSLDALPLTASGKVDRRALPAPEPAADAGRSVPPRTPVQAVLAAIWAEVLRVDRVGVEERFFALGGHSLLATRVVSRVREALGVELPVRALFESPTVAALAAAVEEIRRAELPVLPPVAPLPREGPLPLSFAQERLWFLDRLHPGGALYNVPVALRLHGAPDVGALERALGEIVRRHEALRTVFPGRGGAPLQVVTPFHGLALPVEACADEADARRRVDAEAARPFDLQAGPLFRPALLRVGAEDHVLLLCMHHVVVDEWSFGILFRELSALYAAFARGEPSPLAELPVQYADYAAWQRERLRGEALDAHLAFWTERLAGAPALLGLPTDRPRPAAQTYRGAQHVRELPVELAERLRALGRGEGATLFVVLLGAVQTLLARYCGTDDVVVGTPVAGRTQREVEGLVGFFVNTLALRTRLSGDPGFRDVLRRARATVLEAYEHQDLPFEKLVEALQPERSLAHSPVFQVMCALDEDPRAAAALPGMRTERMDVDLPVAKFDLGVTFVVAPDRFHVVVEYGTDLFDPATAARMGEHLARVLEQAAALPEAPLSTLCLAGDAERRRVVEEWNGTDAEFPADRCIHHLFEARAARSPHLPALLFGETSVTYAELDRRAGALARRLRRLGVGPETRVGLCVERGPDLVVSLLAILKAGGAYLPLDPAYPAERLRFMIADSGVPVLVAGGSAAGALRVPAGVRVVRVDGAGTGPGGEGAEEPGPHARSLAYVVYTSGSTGRPKGVGVEHRSLVSYVVQAVREYGLGPGDRVLQFHSISFDPAAEEIFAALVSGAALVLWPAGDAVDGAAFWAACRRDGVTVLDLPTAVWHALVPVLEARPSALPPSLRLAVTGGEALAPGSLRAWRAVAGGVRLLNSYGPTEATVGATLWDASGAAGEDPPAVVPIGRPVANTRCYVLDAALQPLPAEVPGELYLGGVQVARGYLGRPGTTAERFVPEPFGGRAGTRLYRTGDRARWRADGTLEYLGRLDEQVKIRGFRVEPAEVEAALLADPRVAGAAVGVRGKGSAAALVAWVVPAGGAVDASALREGLRRRVPEHMVPAAWVAVDRLPLTANGKLDRGALPRPDAAANAHRPPRTLAEQLVADVWADVLGVERVGADESFFDLGGHSLLAIRLASRLGGVFGVELTVRALFEAPTVAALAARVEALGRAGGPPPPIVPVERTAGERPSFAQERLWFLDRLQPGSAFYNVPAAMRLRGVPDVRALERALGEIVRRHEALRTVFPEHGGAPLQVVVPFRGLALPVEACADEADARRRMAEEAARPVDLQAGPVFRATLLRVAADDHVLLLCMHHVVTDEWSMGTLFRELAALYGAFARGEPSPLAELAVQYADYAAWQREQLRGAALDRQLAYWRERLAGAPALLELPTDRPRPAVQRHHGAVARDELPRDLLERLRALGRGEGATLYMVLLAAFQVLLGRYAGTDDVVVGSPFAGRARAEVQPLIGLFTNTVVIRTQLGGDGGFREVLGRVRAAALGAYEHQDVPFERLVEELQPERSLGHSPLFQAMFILQDADADTARLPGLAAETLHAPGGTAKFDLTLAMAPHPRGIGVSLEYDTDLFDGGTARRMLAHLHHLLGRIAAAPDAPLSALALLGEDERRLVIHEWNRTDASFPADACVHELFEAQAERTPDAEAVVFQGESLTYAGLNARANRLAHHLIGLGVGADTPVGICLERGAEMIVSVLAVLKAGGACVPLDPGYPAGRLAYMAAGAALPVLVTQASLRASLPPLEGVRIVLADGVEDAAERAVNPPPRALPASLAYVLYTSGSTGTPKGVAQPHAALVNLVAWHQADALLSAPRRTLQFASLSFDVSFQEIAVTLAAGGTLVLVDDELRRDPHRLPGYLARHRVERLFLPFVALQALAEAAGEGAPAVALREIVTAGEQLICTPRLAAWIGGMPGCRLVNHYGPTETHVATAHTLAAGPEGWDALPPIGGPVANTRAYVLNARLAPVPVGIPGELYVAGVQVARGYRGRPALTAERFVPDPFAADGGRMYRTGDRVRWKECALEYLGRADHQTKIRGFRVEPGEVEAALRRHPGVTDCAVVAREDAPGERRLVAYVAGGADAAALRAHLRGVLPEYMVPTAFVAVERLPLTPSGKLDRRALPAPEPAAAEEGYVAPRTADEAALAALWAELLRVERVGIRDGFFALGGHSLLATRVVSRVRRELGVELPLRALFEAPTVEALAARVAAERAGAAGSAPPADPALSAIAAGSPQSLLGALDDLSDEELDRLLAGHP